MPHRYLDPKVIENLDKEIFRHLEALRMSAEYKKELDRPVISDFVKGLKGNLNSIRLEKDSYLIEGTDQSIRNATLLLGKELLAKEIVDSFEGSESFVRFHRNEVERLEKERDTIKRNAEVRED